MSDRARDELRFKERSLSDLARFIGTRNESTPNYSLLLGAGCSISSGIRPATELVKIWRREVIASLKPELADSDDEEMIDYLSRHHFSWYDKSKEYSSLFERRYDLQPQRRRFIENEVSGKKPSIGYAYLTALVNQNYFNTIFTTNFDDLLNEAFFQFSEQRPIICAHDSSIAGVTVTSRRPKIIKLHGDYLFDDIKATARETESLEQNMRMKFTEFAKDSGLVVVGYAGGDRSIMDVLSSLLRNDDYFKTGIYWCIRKGAPISDDLRKLLWKDRVYFVNVDGFDEMCGELYSDFNKGDVVPISTNKVSSRNSEIIKSLIENKDLERSPSEVLRKAYLVLSKESTTNKLYDLIRKSKEEDKGADQDSLDDPELIVLMEAENLIEEARYSAAIDLCRKKLIEFQRSVAKIALLRAIATSHHLAGQHLEACSAADELIAIEPKVANHYLSKIRFLRSVDDKIAAITAAAGADPYHSGTHLARAKILKEQAQAAYGQSRKDKLNEAIQELDRGLERNPSRFNPCWIEKFNALSDFSDRDYVKSERLKLIAELSKQSPLATAVLEMRVQMLTSKSPDNEINHLLADITDAESRARDDARLGLNAIRLDLLAVAGRIDELRRLLDHLKGSAERNVDLGLVAAKLERKKFGDDAAAADLLKKLVESSKSATVAIRLIRCLIAMGLTNDAEAVFSKWSNKMSHDDRSECKVHILEARNEFGAAINEAISYQTLSNSDCSDIDYLWICNGSYAQAESSIRAKLEACSFSLDAESAIINYELTKKCQNKKVDKNRLSNLLKFTQSEAVMAACCLLSGDKQEALRHIRLAIEDDNTLRRDFKRWPAFSELKDDPTFAKLVAMGPNSSRGLPTSIQPLQAYSNDGRSTIAANSAS